MEVSVSCCVRVEMVDLVLSPASFVLGEFVAVDETGDGVVDGVLSLGVTEFASCLL